MTTPSDALLTLVDALKECPTQDNRFSQKKLIESWNCFRQVAPENEDEITPALMAGLVLYDEKQFASLLNEAERTQLAAVSQAAVDRFQAKIHPPNKLGKTIAAALKEL
jgi:hypothetical protein